VKFGGGLFVALKYFELESLSLASCYYYVRLLFSAWLPSCRLVGFVDVLINNCRLGMVLKASKVVGNPVTLHRIW
jgi:hypothetical protein